MNLRTLRPVAATLVAALAASSACAQAAPPAGEAHKMTATDTHIGNGQSYRCDSSFSGQCTILLYTSDCKAGPAQNGRASLVCSHAFLTEFALKVGESKTIEDLPAHVKQCTAANDKPVFPDCAR